MRLRCSGEPTENPSWQQVEDALNALDGDTVSFMALDRGASGGEHIGVGGGADDLVLLYWELPGESSFTARRPAGDWSEDDEVTMVVAGQETEVPMYQLIDRSTAVMILRNYFDNGRRSDVVAWHKEY